LIDCSAGDSVTGNHGRRCFGELRVTITGVRRSKVAQRSTVERIRTSAPVLRHVGQPLRQVPASGHQIRIALGGTFRELNRMPSSVGCGDPSIDPSTATAFGSGDHIDPTQLTGLVTGESQVEYGGLFAA
jgi:hypothetical protein